MPSRKIDFFASDSPANFFVRGCFFEVVHVGCRCKATGYDGTQYRPGLYNIDEATRQYINFFRKKNPEAEEKVDYNTERAKLVRAKREAQELELQMRKNEVHTSEDVEQVMSDMLIRFKTRLMAIPAKLSPIMAKKTDQTDIFQTMKTAVDEALEELSDFNTAFGEESKKNEE